MEHRYAKWETVPLEIMSDVISRKVFTGEKAMDDSSGRRSDRPLTFMRLAQVCLKKDTVVPLDQRGAPIHANLDSLAKVAEAQY